MVEARHVSLENDPRIGQAVLTTADQLLKICGLFEDFHLAVPYGTLKMYSPITLLKIYIPLLLENIGSAARVIHND